LFALERILSNGVSFSSIEALITCHREKIKGLAFLLFLTYEILLLFPQNKKKKNGAVKNYSFETK